MTRIFTMSQDRVQTTGGYLSAVSGPTTLAVIAVAVALAVDSITGGTLEAILVSGLVFLCLTVSLQALMGNTGLIFFGQFAFVAVGAYVSGVLTVPVASRGALLPDLPPWLAELEVSFGVSILAGALAGAVVAAIASPVLVRVSGLAAAVVSLGLLFIVGDIIRESPSITRGAMMFPGVPFGTNIGVAGLTVVVMTLAASAFKFSRWGLQARAGRDDAVAAESSGLSQTRVRMPALVLGGLLSGAGGAVWAHYLTSFSPATFGIDPAIVVVIMAVIGGLNSVSGAIAGASIVVIWQELARQVEGGLLLFGTQLPRLPEFGTLTLGIGLIIVLAVRPHGLLGSRELQFLRPSLSRSSASSGSQPGVQGATDDLQNQRGKDQK